MIALTLALAAQAGTPALDLDLSAPPEAVALSAEETETLLRGETVYRYTREEGLERGVSVTLVDAEPDAIWPHVLDHDAYVLFLPYVTASSDQGVREEAGHPVHDATLEFTTRGITTRFEVENHWLPAEQRLAFTMVSRRGSPVKGAVGWWSAEPWRDDPDRTLLVYQVDLDLSWYVPPWFRRKAATTGLPRLASLIARRAEAPPVTEAP